MIKYEDGCLEIDTKFDNEESCFLYIPIKEIFYTKLLMHKTFSFFRIIFKIQNKEDLIFRVYDEISVEDVKEIQKCFKQYISEQNKENNDR